MKKPPMCEKLSTPVEECGSRGQTRKMSKGWRIRILARYESQAQTNDYLDDEDNQSAYRLVFNPPVRGQVHQERRLCPEDLRKERKS